jgi:hypothetical protein
VAVHQVMVVFATLFVSKDGRRASSSTETEGMQVDRDRVKQVFQECETLCVPGTDSELEAVKAAILVEDVFDLTLSDDEIDVAVLADPSAIKEFARRGGSV